MTARRPPRVPVSALSLLVPLLLATAPGSARGQNYRFNMASMSSTATSNADGVFGTPYNASGSCIGTSCSGGVSASGYHDDGSSSINTVDSNGEILALAKGTSQNNTTASTADGSGINLSISTTSSALAEANYSGSWAQSPAVYKAPFRDGTSMWMSWRVNTASYLNVTNLVGSTGSNLQGGGTGWATATWLITVQLADGTIVAQYNQANSGSTFYAQIPANTIVTIGWSAFTAAKAVYGSKPSSASTMSAVVGTIAITPIGG
jgi:hypothetical protein